MLSIIKSIWRQKSRYLLLLCSVAVGALTVCTVSAISDIGTKLMDEELDAMGLNGLIVTSPKASITESDLQRIAAEDFVTVETPLNYEYCAVNIHGETEKCLVWGVDSRVYDSVTITLLYGRLLQTGDSGLNCMVDASFAKEHYGRENILGKKISLTLNGRNVSPTVVGVVDTGKSLTGQLMGSVVPCFLYLPMDTLRLYTRDSGYNQLMLTLDGTVQAELAAERVSACLASTDTAEVQNMAGSREQLGGILSIFTAVLTALGSVSFLTSGISMMTVMLQNVREQTPQIGVKKAVGASSGMICMEYLLLSLFLSLFGSMIGSGITAAAVLLGIKLLALDVSVNPAIFLLPALPGVLTGSLFGLYPALKAAKCHPADAIAKL